MASAARDDGPDAYIAKPPGPCCWLGTIHKGTPRGRIETILDVPTYVTTPTPSPAAADATAGRRIVLYLPDVWGLSTNAQLLMDGFADAGFLTLGMDYFRGDPISKYRASKDDPFPEGFDHAAWRAKHVAFARENVPRWAEAVRARYGSGSGSGGGAEDRFACVGYCFGAPFVCDLLAGDLVAAGAFAHPTALKEEQFVELKQPLLLSCAENDHAFDAAARTKAFEILQREGKKYHVQLFQGVGHGFAVKGDPEDPYQRWCKEQSLRAMCDWFTLWLGGP